jgi:hypothetical protein
VIKRFRFFFIGTQRHRLLHRSHKSAGHSSSVMTWHVSHQTLTSQSSVSSLWLFPFRHSHSSALALWRSLTRLSCSQLILIRSSQAHDLRSSSLAFACGLLCGASCGVRFISF